MWYEVIELERIDGIGPKTKELIEKIGINSGEDLINHYPFRYDILRRSDITVLNDKDKIVIDGIIEGQPTIIYLNKSLKKIIFRINANHNILNVTLYNRIYLFSDLKPGKEITVLGRFHKLKNTIVASDIRFGLLPNDAKIEPVYSTTEGLSIKSLAKYISSALEEDYDINELVPRYIEEKYNLMSKKDALKNIHIPSDIQSLKKARQRIKYEELFMYMLKVNYMKQKITSDNNAISRNINIFGIAYHFTLYIVHTYSFCVTSGFNISKVA